MSGLNDSLKTIAQLNERTVQLLEAQIRASERLTRTSKDTGKELDGWHTEMRSLLKDSANLEHSMKRIQQLQNAKVAGGASRSGTAEYIRRLKEEQELLFQVMNRGNTSANDLQAMNKALKGYGQALRKVESQSDDAWNAKGIQKVNDLLARAGHNAIKLQKSMERVQVDKMTTGFKKMGRAMDDAFDGQMGRMLRRIPGVQGYQDVKRVGRQASAAQVGIKEFQADRAKQRQQADYAGAQRAVARLGPGAKKTLQGMGYAGGFETHRLLGSTIGGVKKGAPAAALSAASRATRLPPAAPIEPPTIILPRSGKRKNLSKAEKKALRAATRAGSPEATEPSEAGASETPSRADRLRSRFKTTNLSARVPAVGATPSTAAVEEVLGKPGFLGGLFNKVASHAAGGGMGQWAQEKAVGLAAKGGLGGASAGLSESLVSAGSGAMGGAMGLVAKAAPILAIGKGIMDVYDKVAMENQKMQESLGGAGIHGAGAEGVSFQGVRKSLLSTGLGNAAMMGQGLPENMAIMKTLSESGMAVGKTLRGGDLNLGKSLGEHGTNAGEGFYGSVMKNAVYNGKNIGMNQDSSVRLTLKLMEKFGKTTQATQEFFLKLDTMMESSGISASKYIDIIDNVTDEFDSMNKSLTGTLALLTNLGKTGNLTGKAMEEMIKTLQGKNQMSTSQRMFNASNMINSGYAEKAAHAEESNMNSDLGQLAAALKGKGINVEPGDIVKNQANIRQQLANKGLDQQDLQTITSNLDDTVGRAVNSQERISALRSKDPEVIAAAVSAAGESGPLAMYAKMQNLRTIAEKSGESKETVEGLMHGDVDAMIKLSKNLLAQKMNDSQVTAGQEDMNTDFNALRKYSQSGAGAAVGIGRAAVSAEELQKTPQGQAQYATMLALQKERISKGQAETPLGPNGKPLKGKAAESQMVEDFIAKAKGDGSGELAEQLSKSDKVTELLGDSTSVLTKALVDNTDSLKAAAKAKEITQQTRTMADTFAKSFEYLFDRLVGVLDKLIRGFEGFFHFSKDETTSQNYMDQTKTLQTSVDQLSEDTSKLSPTDQATLKDIQGRLKSGAYQDSDTGPAALKADQDALARIQRAPGGEGGIENIPPEMHKKALAEAFASDFRTDQGGQHTGTSTASTLVQDVLGAGGGLKGDDVLKKELAQLTDAIGTDVNGNLVGKSPEGNSLLEQLPAALKAVGQGGYTTTKDKSGNTTFISYGVDVLQDGHITGFPGGMPKADSVAPTAPNAAWH